MNYCYALLCCLLCYGPGAAQQSAWKAYPIDELAVRFPGVPEELNVPAKLAANNSPGKDDAQAQASHAFRAEDATAAYVLVSVPLLTAEPRPGTAAEREAYYKNRSIPLLLTQMRAELLEKSVSVGTRMDSYTVKLRVLTADGTPGVKYLRVVTTNKRVYQLYFIPKDKTGKAGANQRMQFFATALKK